MNKKVVKLIGAIILFAIVVGCSKNTIKQDAPPPNSNNKLEDRFVIIYEHGETKNLGGFTIIKDNKTGQEFMVVTGLNGAPTVVPITGNEPNVNYRPTANGQQNIP